MGDMADDFKAMNEERKARHRLWREKNTKIIEASNVVYESKNFGESFVFRSTITNRTWVTFYPSTGRWFVQSSRITHSGGAQKFLEWFHRRRKLNRE